MVPIPWLVALALQQDGWFLRCDIIWAKPNPMPESVTDRPTCAHEYLFLLTKRARYYYDAEAVKEQTTMRPQNRCTDGRGPKDAGYREDRKCPGMTNPATRNLRSVWTIATAPTPFAHFATYPEALVVPCIKAGTSERGCCTECGAPWERIVVKTNEPDRSAKGSRFDTGKTRQRDGGDRTQAGERTTNRTIGWRPTCACDAGEPVPCTVLDPFFGAGTTGLVAAKLQRNWIGCELNPEYAALAQTRIDHGGDMALVAQAQAGQARLLEVPAE